MAEAAGHTGATVAKTYPEHEKAGMSYMNHKTKNNLKFFKQGRPWKQKPPRCSQPMLTHVTSAMIFCSQAAFSREHHGAE